MEREMPRAATAMHGGSGRLYAAGCRCKSCTEAQRARVAAYRLKRGPMVPPQPVADAETGEVQMTTRERMLALTAALVDPIMERREPPRRPPAPQALHQRYAPPVAPPSYVDDSGFEHVKAGWE